MKQHISTWWPLIANCVLAAGCGQNTQTQLPPSTVQTPTAEPAASVDAALAVRIELDSPTIDLDKPFRVVLTNNSEQPIRIWNPETANGYDQISFQCTNSRTGERSALRKRVIEDQEFWKARDEEIEPDQRVIEIAGRDSFATYVELGQFYWGEFAWTGAPGPNSADRFSVSVQFESKAMPEAALKAIWTGTIQCDAVLVKLIGPRLKTPHDYLWNGFAQRAIEMMKADAKWIAARDDSECAPLHHAARFAHKDAVKWLLDQGANVNAIAYNGFTPLHMTDEPGVIELILQKKPDLTIRCRILGQTPLQRAAENLVDSRRAKEREKWLRIVQMFQNAGAEYDLLSAIYRGDLARVKSILKQSPQFADDFQQRSPLRTAASLGQLEICRHLIDVHQVDVDDFERGGGYPIIKGALAHPPIVRLLIESGADLESRITFRGDRSGFWFIGDDATALHYAASEGVPETINLLIDRGVDIFATTHDLFNKQTTQTALEVATHFGKADNASAIVSHPKFDAADPQLRQALLVKCLHIGAWSSQKVIKVLVDKGANPNASENGITAVRIAARRIHPNSKQENSEIKQMIAFLSEHGATVDLFSAVAIGDDQQVHRLLKHDPQSANSRGPDGYPALHFAVGMDYKSIVAALLKAGGAVDIRNESESTGYVGETALHCAAFWGREELARLLLDAGADVNAQTNRKSTPLHDAARMTNVKLVRLLLEKGANPDARDKNNETPLDWCRELNWTNAAEVEKIFREQREPIDK